MKLDIVAAKTPEDMTNSLKKPFDLTKIMQDAKEDNIPIIEQKVYKQNRCKACKWIIATLFCICIIILGISITLLIFSRENNAKYAKFRSTSMDKSLIDFDVLLSTDAKDKHLSLDDVHKLFEQRNSYKKKIQSGNENSIDVKSSSIVDHEPDLDNSKKAQEKSETGIVIKPQNIGFYESPDPNVAHKTKENELNLKVYNYDTADHDNGQGTKIAEQQYKNLNANHEKNLNHNKSTIWDRYVKCSHFKTVVVNQTYVNPSWTAVERCETYGVSVLEVMNGIKRSNHKYRSDVPAVNDRFIHCEDAFDATFEVFTSRMLKNYERCVESGALNKHQQSIIETKHERIFKVIKHSNEEFISAVRHYTNYLNVTIKISNFLVNCESLPLNLQNLCRNIGVTLSQIVLFKWDLVGEGWLVDQDMQKLFLTCNDILQSENLTGIPMSILFNCLIYDTSDYHKRFTVIYE